MNKEETLEKVRRMNNIAPTMETQYVTETVALKAMDEYAKQEALRFVNWMFDNQMWNKTISQDGEEKYFRGLTNPTDRKFYSLEELYKNLKS